MSYVVTLIGYAPPARFDGRRFTEAKIEEAVSEAGPWEPIQTLLLEPADADPTHPVERTLTVTKAALVDGFYRVVWIDQEGSQTAPTGPVETATEGGPRPRVAEVAALLRARTKIKGGTEAGNFDSRTRPTGDEVDSLISEALDEVLGKVQTPTAESDYERRVRRAVTLYAAILIETSYFPEQAKSPGSAVTVYQALYTSRIKALIAEGETGTPEGMGDTDAPAGAAWIFPGGGSGLGSAVW